MKLKNLNVKIDEQLFREIKKICIDHDTTIQKITPRAIKKYIKDLGYIKTYNEIEETVKEEIKIPESKSSKGKKKPMCTEVKDAFPHTAEESDTVVNEALEDVNDIVDESEPDSDDEEDYLDSVSIPDVVNLHKPGGNYDAPEPPPPGFFTDDG
jgi:hypothetical protein